MADYTLTVLDVVGIQDYIFGSNKLRENVGASQLVEAATSKWVAEALGVENLGAIQGPSPAGWTDTVSLVYRGGGNVVLLFRGESSGEMAHRVVSDLSRLVVTRAPGLELAVAHHGFEWSEPIGGRAGVYARLMDKLATTKQRRRSVPLLGQSVTLNCRSTGLPAVSFDPVENHPVSADIRAKVDPGALQAADQRLWKFLGSEVQREYAFRADFDKLGRSYGESSYLAVVHADGNGMGARFKELVEGFSEAKENGECLRALGILSQAVERAGQTALCETIAYLVNAFKDPRRNAAEDGLMALLHDLARDEEGRPVLPWRPLVFGGDDVTFVCDGRLGLGLAATYLQKFEEAAKELPDRKEPAYACAGVAVVKAHYPFARAYALSEQLAQSAKQVLRDAERAGSALDWHFAATGISGPLGDLRHRGYQTDAGHLTMRPVSLDEGGFGGEGWRSWLSFTTLTHTLTTHEDWKGRCNKIIGLREILRRGPEATKRYLTQYGMRQLPPTPQFGSDMREKGWDDGRCGYFDAIEALDFYLAL